MISPLLIFDKSNFKIKWCRNRGLYVQLTFLSTLAECKGKYCIFLIKMTPNYTILMKNEATATRDTILRHIAYFWWRLLTISHDTNESFIAHINTIYYKIYIVHEHPSKFNNIAPSYVLICVMYMSYQIWTEFDLVMVYIYIIMNTKYLFYSQWYHKVNDCACAKM